TVRRIHVLLSRRCVDSPFHRVFIDNPQFPMRRWWLFPHTYGAPPTDNEHQDKSSKHVLVHSHPPQGRWLTVTPPASTHLRLIHTSAQARRRRRSRRRKR